MTFPVLRQGVAFLALSLFLLFDCGAALAYNQADEEFCAPYQPVEVIVTPVFDKPILDDSLPLRAIQALSHQGENVIPHSEQFALGLTSYSPMVQFGSRIIKKPLQDGSFCARVDRVDVEMGYRNVVISIGAEFRGDACAFGHVLAHEEKHVAVNAALLQEYAPQVQRRLAQVLRQNGAFRVATEELADRLVRDRLQAELKALAADLFQENKRRQAMIDTPGEYATNATACGGRVQALSARAFGR